MRHRAPHPIGRRSFKVSLVDGYAVLAAPHCLGLTLAERWVSADPSSAEEVSSVLPASLTADSGDSVGRCAAQPDDRSPAELNQADSNQADSNRVVVVCQVPLTVDSDGSAGSRLGDWGAAGLNRADSNRVDSNQIDSNRAAEVLQGYLAALTADWDASVYFHPASSGDLFPVDCDLADFDPVCSASRACLVARTEASVQASPGWGSQVVRALLVYLV